MRVLVVGATGRIGSRVVSELLARGFEVSALVRSPGRYEAPAGVRVLAGDVTDRTSLLASVAGHDAVVSAVGPGRGGDPRVLSVGAANLALAMAEQGIRRLVVLSAAGILQRDAGSLRRDAPGYPPAFRAGSGEHLRAYETLAASSLDWTIVCPPELVPGHRDQALHLAEDQLPDGPRRVAMEALARLMVDVLASGEHARVRLGMVNAS